MILEITSIQEQVIQCEYDQSGKEIFINRQVTLGFHASHFSGELTFQSNRVYGFDSPLDEIAGMIRSVLERIEKEKP